MYFLIYNLVLLLIIKNYAILIQEIRYWISPYRRSQILQNQIIHPLLKLTICRLHPHQFNLAFFLHFMLYFMLYFKLIKIAFSVVLMVYPLKIQDPSINLFLLFNLEILDKNIKSTSINNIFRKNNIQMIFFF